MPVAPQCRENAARAVFINAPITQDLLSRLTPQILKLRQDGTNEPITAYIDSLGGSPLLADRLMALLRAPDADGRDRPLVPVVTGIAASAAADFLSAGRYSIAYPDATVHFHGTRYAKQEGVTMESAAFTAKFLRESNERLAVELAGNIVGRSIFIYLNLRDSFDEIRKHTPGASDVECFARTLARELSAGADMLPVHALRRYKDIQTLSDYAFGRLTIKAGDRVAKGERAILRAVIDYEYRATKRDRLWSFTEEKVEKIAEDFRLIKDFVVGSHNESIGSLAKNFGEYFLTPEDGAALKANAFANEDERDTFLQDKAIPHLRPLWYFIVSICRLLQEKENPLTAEDAYWLGVVNEVLGSGLPCIRQIVENPPAQAEPEPA